MSRSVPYLWPCPERREGLTHRIVPRLAAPWVVQAALRGLTVPGWWTDWRDPAKEGA